MARYVDRKPNSDSRTVDALVIEDKDTFADIIQILDKNAVLKVVHPVFRNEPVRYWVIAGSELEFLAVSQIEQYVREGKFDELPGHLNQPLAG